jgi:sulfate transport system permease protein
VSVALLLIAFVVLLVLRVLGRWTSRREEAN